MAISERIDWIIVQKGMWVATHKQTGKVLVAYTRSKLNTKINAYDKESA